jgi:hypothetical protein
MELAEQGLIEEECERLVITLVHHSDHGDLQKAVELFTADATWVRGGKPFTGHDQMLESFAAQSQTAVTRHLTSNIRISVADENNAAGVSYYMAMRHDPETDDAALPLPMNLPFSMGEYHDKFVRTPDGWRISHRVIKRVFQRG